jgi:hypothetical protein
LWSLSDRSHDLDVWGDPLLLIDGHASLTLSHFRRLGLAREIW